ncbi:MAG: hypothetical protein ACE5LU_01505 [Anaerolineae bacterium]
MLVGMLPPPALLIQAHAVGLADSSGLRAPASASEPGIAAHEPAAPAGQPAALLDTAVGSPGEPEAAWPPRLDVPWPDPWQELGDIPPEDGGPPREVPVLSQHMVTLAPTAPSQDQLSEAITVFDFGFAEAETTVVAGAAVVWQNTAPVTHRVASVALCPLQGDFPRKGAFGTCDCQIDAVDLQVMAVRWRSRVGDAAYHPGFDMDDDGDIDIADIMANVIRFGLTCDDEPRQEVWASGPIAPGESFTRTFSTPGTFAYLDPDYTTMQGTVRVVSDLGARFISIHAGLMQGGEVNTTLPRPFVAYVTDAGNQPVGGAPVTFPNDTGLAPGTRLSVYSFDHETARFEIVAEAEVTADGQWIKSLPGQGLIHGGWHGPGRPGRRTTVRGRSGNGCNLPCQGTDQGNGDTDPVALHNGEFTIMAEDLRIRGRGFDFVLSRNYRSRCNCYRTDYASKIGTISATLS